MLGGDSIASVNIVLGHCSSSARWWQYCISYKLGARYHSTSMLSLGQDYLIWLVTTSKSTERNQSSSKLRCLHGMLQGCRDLAGFKYCYLWIHACQITNQHHTSGGGGGPDCSACLSMGNRDCNRADFRFVHSQWERMLLCNDISHWLGASLESALL